jgi:uncharacterized protein
MNDRSVIAVQLDRQPRGQVSVAVRCEYGLPMVIRTSALVDNGEPFPTLYWLTCPIASRRIGGLESSGAMNELNARLASDGALASEYEAAHARYLKDRDGDGDGPEESAGGMPSRVKCLHALYAHELADGNPIGAIARERIEPLDCPGPCVGEDLRRVPGHPGFARRAR